MGAAQGDVGLLASDVAQRLLASTMPARVVYTGIDGKPCVVPVDRVVPEYAEAARR